MLNLQPDLSGNPFLRVLKFYFNLKLSCKKDWERKAEIAALNIILENFRISVCFLERKLYFCTSNNNNKIYKQCLQL